MILTKLLLLIIAFDILMMIIIVEYQNTYKTFLCGETACMSYS